MVTPALYDEAALPSLSEKAESVLCEVYAHYVSAYSSDDWAISLKLARWVARYVYKEKPRAAADLGSGFTSWLLRWCQVPTVHSVETDDRWRARTAKFLRGYSQSSTDLFLWNAWEGLTETYELLVYDLGVKNRDVVLWRHGGVIDRVAPGGLLVLDDVHRPAYRERCRCEAEARGWTFQSLNGTCDRFGRWAAIVRKPQ